MDDLIDHYQNTDDLIKSYTIDHNKNKITMMVDTIEDECTIVITRINEQLFKCTNTTINHESDGGAHEEQASSTDKEYQASTLLQVTQKVLEELGAVRDKFLEQVCWNWICHFCCCFCLVN